MTTKFIAILGTVGVPAKYGGFETLVDNLVRYHYAHALQSVLTVYCSHNSYPVKAPCFLSANLKYIPFRANGIQSILYDVVSLMSALLSHSDVILLLGVSGAIALPLIRTFFSTRIITNIDGIEWRRKKWRGWARLFLRWSEQLAIRYSHEVIADNAVIADYVKKAYGVECHLIAYGGDHAVKVEASQLEGCILPKRYAFSVCRIEPENNIHMILEAFANQPLLPLVIVGNWNNNKYGRNLRKTYAHLTHLHLLDPIYDLGKLKTLRQGMLCYVHGHSMGGTNPSLVEAMHFAKPILAFDCNFNRATTKDMALYFKNADELVSLIKMINSDGAKLYCVGKKMLEIAKRYYTWDVVAKQYFDLLNRD